LLRIVKIKELLSMYYDRMYTPYERFSLGQAVKDTILRGGPQGYEREVSQEQARLMGRSTDGFYMPLTTRATYATNQPSTGGNLVATQLDSNNFIDALRPRSVVQLLGATVLTGLKGNIAIPRQITATNTYWIAENDPITQNEGTFDQVTMTPKILGARSTYTRLMLQQSTPDIERVIRNDMSMGLAIELDRVALAGTGTNAQPLGILNQVNIPTYSMGNNGNPFTNTSTTSGSGIDPLIELEGLVAGSNAPINSTWGYVTNSKVASALRKLKSSNNFTYLTDQYPKKDIFGEPIIMSTGLPQAPMLVNGYGLYATNNIPSNLVKGNGTNLSAVIFGAWSELLIGFWGALEITVNPYAHEDYIRGNVSIRAMLTCDIAIKHVNSFAVIKDIVT